MQRIKRFKSNSYIRTVPDNLLERNYFENIPVDIKLLIFSFLDVESILAVNQVSRQFNQLTNKSRFWKTSRFSTRFQGEFFAGLSDVKAAMTNFRVQVAVVSNNKYIHYQLKEVHSAFHPILKSIKVESTSGQVNTYHFCLRGDSSLSFGLSHSMIDMHFLQIIIFFPQSDQDLSLLKIDLYDYQQAISAKNKYQSRSNPLVFVVVDQNLLVGINDHVKNQLNATLGAIHFYIGSSWKIQHKMKIYDFDKIIENLALKLDHLITKHHSFLNKQQMISSDDDHSRFNCTTQLRK